MATSEFWSMLQDRKIGPLGVQRRNREMLATYRCLRDLCWEVLAAGDEIGPRRLLTAAGVEPDSSEKDLWNIPPSGPVLVAGDRSPSVIESLAAAELLRRVRPDAKVLASHLIARVSNLDALFIGYDRWRTRCDSPINLRATFAALDHLRSGGLLAVFPADVTPVAVGRPADQSGWATLIRTSRLCNARIVPASFDRLQQPRAKDARIKMLLGTTIDPKRLGEFSDNVRAGAYVRWRTTLLRDRNTPSVRLVSRLYLS